MSGGLKATVVSLFPWKIEERKPTVSFVAQIPAPAPGDFSILHVPFSTASRYVMDGKTIPIPIMPAELAESIVYDFCSNQLCSGPDVGPGLFWIPGQISHEELLKPGAGYDKILKDEKGNVVKTEFVKYSDLIDSARARQHRWYEALIKMADSDWARYEDHKFISPLARHAAKELGLDRVWAIDATTYNKVVYCPACTSKVPARAVVCPTCQCVLDKERFKTLEFANRKTA